jgi:hypothetical protein
MSQTIKRTASMCGLCSSTSDWALWLARICWVTVWPKDTFMGPQPPMHGPEWTIDRLNRPAACADDKREDRPSRNARQYIYMYACRQHKALRIIKMHTHTTIHMDI